MQIAATERKGLKPSWGDGNDFPAGSCPPIQLSYHLPLVLSLQPLSETAWMCMDQKKNPERDSGVYILLSNYINW